MATRKETPDVIDVNGAVPELDPDAHVLLKFTGIANVVVPFGELHFGEIVATPKGLLAPLLASGLFTPYDGPALDQGAVRHV